jgi:hypothetical protein
MTYTLANPAFLLAGIVVILWLTVLAKPATLWCVMSAGVFCNGLGLEVGGYLVRWEFIATLFVGVAFSLRRGPAELHAPKIPPSIKTFAGLWLAVGLASSLVVALSSSASLSSGIQLGLAMVGFVIAWSVPMATGKKVLYTHRTFGWLSLVSLLFYLNSDQTRLVGFAFEPNILGSMTATWLALVFVALPTVRSSFRLQDAFWCLCILVTCLATVTRAAWLILAILVFAAVMDRLRHRPAAIFMLVGILLGGIVFASAIATGDWPPESWQWRAQHVLETSSGTGGYRLATWDQALVDIQTRQSGFFWGTGFNSYSQFHTLDATGVDVAYLSSLWIGIVYDTGVLGAFLALSLFVAIASQMKGTLIRASVLLVSIAFAGMITNLVWFTFPWVFVALAVRLARALNSQEGDAHSESMAVVRSGSSN